MSHNESFMSRVKETLFQIYYRRVRRIDVPATPHLSSSDRTLYEQAYRDAFRLGYGTGLSDGFKEGLSAAEVGERSGLADLDLSAIPSTSIGLA